MLWLVLGPAYLKDSQFSMLCHPNTAGRNQDNHPPLQILYVNPSWDHSNLWHSNFSMHPIPRAPLSWFSKFSRFSLQDRPAFPQSFTKTTLEPSEDCAEFKVCFLNPALPPLTSWPWQGLNHLITQHWTFSIFHPMMSQIEMQGPQSIWILYCSSSGDGKQTSPHQNLHSDRKTSLCQITTEITSLHKQQEQWNGKKLPCKLFQLARCVSYKV